MHFSRSRLFTISMVTFAASFIAREAAAVQPVSDCSKWVSVVQWGGPMFYVGTASLKQGATTIDTSVSEVFLSAAGQIMPGGTWTVSPAPGSYQASLVSFVYVGATHALSQSERNAWPPSQIQSTSGSSASFSCGTNPPAITSTPGTHARVGEAYNYQIQISYSGNTSALRYYFVGGPQYMSVGELTGIVQFTAQTSDIGLRPVILRVNGENNLFTVPRRDF